MLVNKLAGRTVSRLAFWLVGWLAGWLVGWLAGRLAGWLVGWLAGRLAGRFVGAQISPRGEGTPSTPDPHTEGKGTPSTPRGERDTIHTRGERDTIHTRNEPIWADLGLGGRQGDLGGSSGRDEMSKVQYYCRRMPKHSLFAVQFAILLQTYASRRGQMAPKSAYYSRHMRKWSSPES